ncbi:MAG TPA: hypothetical protein VN241_14665 [Microbacterium sp.]|nr:hypothetical protein [Microbacterium sp.]
MRKSAFKATERMNMSDSSTTPEEDQPLIPSETVPRQESDDPLHDAKPAQATDGDDEGDDQIDLEDLP